MSTGDQTRRRVGFWLGSASLEIGGVGPYALRIIHDLLTNPEPGWEFAVLTDQELPPNLERLVAGLQGIAIVHEIPSRQSHAGAQSPKSPVHNRLFSFLRKPAAPPEREDEPLHWMRKWIDNLNLDLLHFPTQFPLHTCLQVPYVVRAGEVSEMKTSAAFFDLRVPFIVTMHDVQELHFPEYFTPLQRAIRAVQYWKWLERAGKVIVSYRHVKEDLIKYFHLPEEKIHVCPIPFNAISLREPASGAALAYREKYVSRMPYLLYPAQTWRHKNHMRLLQALEKAQLRQHLGLICTGQKNEYYRELAAEIERLNLRPDSVLFTGLVPEDELSWLYRHAALVTIPTEYEAGSFPLLEAMKHGAPVICSNVTSLPETIGDRRFVFDPRDVEALSDLILRMLTDERLRRENVANNSAQAAKLKHVRAAHYFYETYRSLLESDVRNGRR